MEIAVPDYYVLILILTYGTVQLLLMAHFTLYRFHVFPARYNLLHGSFFTEYDRHCLYYYGIKSQI